MLKKSAPMLPSTCRCTDSCKEIGENEIRMIIIKESILSSRCMNKYTEIISNKKENN